ncbi:hypothetical protein P9274_20080 [Schinkia azotoformans]|uniref:hypothetical protein n=1 Tax=Schinkia azotoformans TaxID=1454 RepID=UPI002E206AE9|nr:hypothetical protein [Schinkia azotoformans]
MESYALKIVNGSLVIDMNKMTEDYSRSYGYDGNPSLYDTGDLVGTEPFIIIELSEGHVKKIMDEYENGGECGWCGEVKKELRSPHLLDFVQGEKMCRDCWEMDRETYKGSLGEDIGPFDE